MQTIGEKIEETRKRKGISLSEAAEATKIRKDFLIKIESNEHDYDLPEIYRRGFIKNYAKFLKLAPEKVISQYQEQLIAQSSKSKKSNSDFFSTNSDFITETDQESIDPLSAKASHGEISLNQPSTKFNETSSRDETSQEKEIYAKTTIIGVSTLIFVLGIFWLIQTISKSGSSNQTAQSTAVISSASESLSNDAISSKNEEYPVTEITLKTSGAVYVQIRQKIDNKIILAQRLLEGQIQTLKRRGPVDIVFTKGSLLTLIADGVEGAIRPNTENAGKITLP